MVFCSMALCFTLLYLRIAWLVSTPFYAETAQSQSRYTLTLSQNRGRIYDCRFSSLTDTETLFQAAVFPSEENFEAIAAHAVSLSRDTLQTLWETGKPCLIEVDSADIEGENIWIFSTTRRYRSDGLVQHVLGYTDSSGQGAAGVERGYDETLSAGTAQSVTFTVDALGRGVHLEEVSQTETKSGGVVLTIDAQIQKIAQEAGRAGLEQGAIVVMESQTGKLRAVCSFPEYDPENLSDALADEKTTPLMNRAFQAFSVGSVFKILTAAAALEQGISPAWEYVCTGAITLDGTTYRCHHLAGHGSLNLRGALMESCNPYFVALAEQLDTERLWELACGCGFGCSAQLGDNLITASGTLPDPEQLQNSGVRSNLSFGQGALSATPVQIAGLVSAVVNGGSLPSPSLVEGLTENGETLSQARSSAQSTQVMSEESAAILKEDLFACVMEQEGQNAAAPDGEYAAGGKTGTAQTGQFYDSGEEKSNGWFAGFFTAGGVEYTVVVLAQNAESGNQNAAPVFREIALAMIKAL